MRVGLRDGESVMRAWLVFMQLTRDLFAIAKFLLSYAADKQTDRQTDRQTNKQTNKQTDSRKSRSTLRYSTVRVSRRFYSSNQLFSSSSSSSSSNLRHEIQRKPHINCVH